jgi:hypothetical protein
LVLFRANLVSALPARRRIPPEAALEALKSHEEPAEVISLSAGQVGSLLSAIDLHRSMLQVGHDDARRVALEGLRPAYLLDFELITRYALRAHDRPDWVSELQYLLCREQTTLLIGPGTELEIDKFIYSIGFLKDADGNLIDRFPEGRRTRRVFGLEPEILAAGLDRLSRLLKLPNVRRYDDLLDEPDVDQDVLDTVKAALDIRRKDKEDANWADALNCAAVVYLRNHASEVDQEFHPYLLTATKPLLDEAAWSESPPVSRRPSDAVYTEVLLDTFTDPSKAAAHTVEMAFKASSLERELRMMPAYLSPAEFEQDPELERAVENDCVGNDLRRQLADLASFVRDPVITEAQRIYDNARLATVSAIQQLGAESRPTKSPRKLFDLIVEISAALSAERGKTGLGELWQTVLQFDEEPGIEAGGKSFRLKERGTADSSRDYFAADWYIATEANEREQNELVLRWPTSLDAEAVTETFSRAFLRHDNSKVDLVVGTDRRIEHFTAELPINLQEVLTAVRDDESGGFTSKGVSQLRWIRMGGDDFDLYADLSAADVSRQPVVGVFVHDANPAHLEDLYLRTSARYLLPAWLRKALEALKESSAQGVSSEG